MDQERFEQQVARAEKAAKDFATLARMLIEQTQALVEVIKANRESIEAYDRAFFAKSELMTAQIEVLKALPETMQALIKSNADTNVTINENTEKMKALLAKVESYFGSGEGLEFEN